MNRIYELAKQAEIEIDDDGALESEPIYYITQETLMQFASLLVKESINVVNRRYMGDNNREDMEVRRCVEDLKKHFGVE